MSEYSSQLASSTFVLVGLSVGLDVGTCVVGGRVGDPVGKNVGINVGFNEGMTFVEAAPSCCPSPGSSCGAVDDDGKSSASDSNADDDDDALLLSEFRLSDRGTATATTMAARRVASPAATRHRRDAAILPLGL